jgi:hypothetical protein
LTTRYLRFTKSLSAPAFTGRCQDGTAVAETSEQLEATLPIGRVLSTVARADEHPAEDGELERAVVAATPAEVPAALARKLG